MMGSEKELKKIVENIMKYYSKNIQSSCKCDKCEICFEGIDEQDIISIIKDGIKNGIN